MRSRKKRQLWRIPVAGHEAFQVPAIPGRLLIFNHFANCDPASITSVLARARDDESGNYPHQQKQVSHKPSVKISFASFRGRGQNELKVGRRRKEQSREKNQAIEKKS